MKAEAPFSSIPSPVEGERVDFLERVNPPPTFPEERMKGEPPFSFVPSPSRRGKG
jgi:hypothetical protein